MHRGTERVQGKEGFAMIRRSAILLLALVGMMAATGVFAQGGSGDTSADQAAIRQIWVGYANAVMTGNVDAYMALWADGGVQMPPGVPPNVGKDTIRASTAKKMAGGSANKTVMKIDPQEITILGDYAYSRGLYTVDVTGADGSVLAHTDGKFMTILRKQADGSWKIYRDIFNSNVPPS
jgi:uncharacterized protein (TIGR02246 family)